MLHCFGFFFQFILFFFSFRITVTVPRAKPMLFLHTTSPFEAKDRGAEMENGAHRAKSLPRAGGEQGGGSGGGLQPPLSIPPARGRARRSVLVAAPARGSVHPRLLWPRAGRCGAVILAGLGAGVAPRLACTKAKPSEPNTRRRSRPGGGDERVFGCVLFFGTRGGAAPPPWGRFAGGTSGCCRCCRCSFTPTQCRARRPTPPRSPPILRLERKC